MCGKDLLMGRLDEGRPGSPPHVRERLTAFIRRILEQGITPACAGKTSKLKTLIAAKQDHPRMCGKDKEAQATALSDIGSPPHVRERLI